MYQFLHRLHLPSIGHNVMQPQDVVLFFFFWKGQTDNKHTQRICKQLAGHMNWACGDSSFHSVLDLRKKKNTENPAGLNLKDVDSSSFIVLFT